MTLSIRPAIARDATALGQLAEQFAQYLRSLGDTGELSLTTEAILDVNRGQVMP
jgi:hypothetical protein